MTQSEITIAALPFSMARMVLTSKHFGPVHNPSYWVWLYFIGFCHVKNLGCYFPGVSEVASSCIDLIA